MKVGRKAIVYSPKITDRIIDRLIAGDSMRKICRANKGIPSRPTIVKWLKNIPDFKASVEAARELQADTYFDLVLDKANACTEKNVSSSALKIKAYQWMAKVLAPKRYGDKAPVEQNNTQVNMLNIAVEPERYRAIVQDLLDSV